MGGSVSPCHRRWGLIDIKMEDFGYLQTDKSKKFLLNMLYFCVSLPQTHSYANISKCNLPRQCSVFMPRSTLYRKSKRENDALRRPGMFVNKCFVISTHLKPCWYQSHYCIVSSLLHYFLFSFVIVMPHTDCSSWDNVHSHPFYFGVFILFTSHRAELISNQNNSTMTTRLRKLKPMRIYLFYCKLVFVQIRSFFFLLGPLYWSWGDLSGWMCGPCFSLRNLGNLSKKIKEYLKGQVKSGCSILIQKAKPLNKLWRWWLFGNNRKIKSIIFQMKIVEQHLWESFQKVSRSLHFLGWVAKCAVLLL